MKFKQAQWVNHHHQPELFAHDRWADGSLAVEEGLQFKSTNQQVAATEVPYPILSYPPQGLTCCASWESLFQWPKQVRPFSCRTWALKRASFHENPKTSSLPENLKPAQSDHQACGKPSQAKPNHSSHSDLILKRTFNPEAPPATLKSVLHPASPRYCC